MKNTFSIIFVAMILSGCGSINNLFDGKDIDMIKKMNKKYFGIEHTETHSESKALYISTLWG